MPNILLNRLQPIGGPRESAGLANRRLRRDEADREQQRRQAPQEPSVPRDGAAQRDDDLSLDDFA